jgi:predicted O-methyltransferase YrrM
MSQELWNAVDDYLSSRLIPADPLLEAVVAASEAAGLPAIQVAPNQGKLLQLLAQMCDARRILEIGTLGGYSTIWLARALGVRGQLVTLEVEAKHAEVARGNFARAGLEQVIELRLARASDSLAQLIDEGSEPFDLIFIDADKPSTSEYFSQSLELSHPGTVIVVDNVVRGGAVADAASRDENVQGVRRFYDMLAGERRVSATAIQTVGSKGYDGLVIALVTSV